MQRLSYLRDPIGYIESCQRRYGDVFSLKLVKRGMVLVCTPELVKEMYTAPDDVLAAGEAKIAIFGKVLGNSSTLLIDGADHVRRRRLLLPRFRGEILQGFAPLMIDVCRKTLAEMPRGEVFALHPYLHRVAFEVICEALFSATPPANRAPLVQVLRDFANRAVTSRLLMFPALQRDLGRLSPWGRVLRLVARARTAVMDEIARRRKQGAEAEDITGLLLSARHEDGSPLNDLEIRDEILTTIAAGHETTAMALTWLAYAIYTRPAVLAKLRAEVAGKSSAELDALPYLEAVIRESLRYYSVIPNGSGRIAKRAFRLGDYEIPAGAMVSAAFHAVHRGAGVFERANEFWPERYLGAKFTPYESIPFGGGTRRCLGMPFALLEMKLVIATLVTSLDLEIAQARVKPVWRGAFLTPAKGLLVRARSRIKQAARA